MSEDKTNSTSDVRAKYAAEHPFASSMEYDAVARKAEAAKNSGTVSGATKTYAEAHPFASSMEYDAFAAGQRRAAERAQEFQSEAAKASDAVLSRSPAMLVARVRMLEAMIRGATISAACTSSGTITVTLNWGA